jgi:hypothetical protein
MNYKKIIFQQAYRYVDGFIKKPNSSTSYPPKWYKDQKLFSNKENDVLKAEKNGSWQGTYKMCIPLVDSLTAGYMIELPADVLVVNKSNDGGYEPFLKWNVDFNVLDSQPIEGLGNYPIPQGYNDSFFRWAINWQIITPEGYSLWITHPSHRHELPFFTLTGFVDTDKHPSPLFLPFFIKDGFEGIIYEGTPIAQIIPIKRENWKSFDEKYSEQKSINFINSVKLNFIRTYKNKYWTKKRYE